mmetsp:Transcript_24208/g.35385  ORF Transcript_24208/g.35385 Transcript_24208/m.35385 type:complete len:369 (+) Transcript_24208:76-1182(+)
MTDTVQPSLVQPNLISDTVLPNLVQPKIGEKVKKTWPAEIHGDADVAGLSNDGNFIDCGPCEKKIKMRHPFALNKWHSHKTCQRHEKLRESKKRKSMGKEEGGPPLMSELLVKKPKKDEAIPNKSNEMLSDNFSEPIHGISSKSEITMVKMPPRMRGCEGLIPFPMSCDTSQRLTLFFIYGAIDANARYKFKMLLEQPQLFAKSCTDEGIFRSEKRSRGHRCDNCEEMRKTHGKKISFVVNRRGDLFMKIKMCLMAPFISEEDIKCMVNFTRQSDTYLTEKGKALIQRIKRELEFCRRCKEGFPSNVLDIAPKTITQHDKKGDQIGIVPNNSNTKTEEDKLDMSLKTSHSPQDKDYEVLAETVDLKSA